MDTINQEALVTTDNSYWAIQALALDRLMKNEDFKTVILEGYFKDRAVQGVSLLAKYETKRAGVRPEILESLIAISHLEDHFNTIRQMGMYAEQDAEMLEEMVEEGN